MSHEHYWFYLHTVYSAGEDKAAGLPESNDAVEVVRYCDCGAKQIARATKWRKLPRGHDARKMIDEGTLV